MTEGCGNFSVGSGQTQPTFVQCPRLDIWFRTSGTEAGAQGHLQNVIADSGQLVAYDKYMIDGFIYMRWIAEALTAGSWSVGYRLTSIVNGSKVIFSPQPWISTQKSRCSIGSIHFGAHLRVTSMTSRGDFPATYWEARFGCMKSVRIYVRSSNL
jgi:hypothetical protein